MADKLGYTFLADDSSWNYGRLSDYFEPSVLSCVPPTDWSDYRKAYPIYQGKSWRYDKKGRPRKRLRYSRAFLSNLDDLTRETYFEGDKNAESELVTLRENDEGHRLKKDRWILEEGGSLPRVFEGVFRDHSAAVQGAWRLNREMQEVVEELKGRTSLDESKRLEGSNSGRGPVIGYSSFSSILHFTSYILKFRTNQITHSTRRQIDRIRPRFARNGYHESIRKLDSLHRSGSRR